MKHLSLLSLCSLILLAPACWRNRGGRCGAPCGAPYACVAPCATPCAAPCATGCDGSYVAGDCGVDQGAQVGNGADADLDDVGGQKYQPLEEDDSKGGAADLDEDIK